MEFQVQGLERRRITLPYPGDPVLILVIAKRVGRNIGISIRYY